METQPELFSMPRYRINVILLRIMGQWPYQSKVLNQFITITWLILFASLYVPQIHLDIVNPTAETFMASFPPQMATSVSVVKMINNIFQSKKIKQMLTLMQDEWGRVKPGSEFDIMLQYANDAHKYVIIYMLIYYNFMMVFLVMPFRAKLMFMMGLSQTPAEFGFPYPGDYWVDDNKNFIYIEIHMVIGTILVITALIAIDTLFIVFVQHACSLFATVCNRLENIPIQSLSNTNISIDKNSDEAFEIISCCIRKHNKAIQFADIIRTAYMWSFFFGVGINMVLLTFSGIQIVTNLDNMDEVIRYAPFAIGQIIHIFVESLISQQLMNHSSQIGHSVAMIKWYAISINARKLLNLITLRSRILCRLTAGPIFILSVEFFVAVVKTSMSYFTVLLSMREDE